MPAPMASVGRAGGGNLVDRRLVGDILGTCAELNTCVHVCIHPRLCVHGSSSVHVQHVPPCTHATHNHLQRADGLVIELIGRCDCADNRRPGIASQRLPHLCPCAQAHMRTLHLCVHTRTQANTPARLPAWTHACAHGWRHRLQDTGKLGITVRNVACLTGTESAYHLPLLHTYGP